MRHEVYALNIPGVNATGGDARDIRNLTRAAVFVHKSGAATFSFKIQVKVSSIDDADINDDWIDLTGAITAAGIYPIADQTTGAPLAATHVRIFRTTLAAGTPLANVGGLNVRTDL